MQNQGPTKQDMEAKTLMKHTQHFLNSQPKFLFVSLSRVLTEQEENCKLIYLMAKVTMFAEILMWTYEPVKIHHFPTGNGLRHLRHHEPAQHQQQFHCQQVFCSVQKMQVVVLSWSKNCVSCISANKKFQPRKENQLKTWSSLLLALPAKGVTMRTHYFFLCEMSLLSCWPRLKTVWYRVPILEQI